MSATSSLCERCQTPLEHGDLRCCICGCAAPPELAVPATTSVKILRCQGCGVAMAYDPQHQALSCSFCGSVVELETLIDPMEQTESYLPFTVSSDEAQAALKNWLGSLGWFRPSDLRSASRLHELRPLWWVAWVFDADTLISWTADSNAGSRRSSWAPHAGQTDVRFSNILSSASRGISTSEASAMAQGVDLNSGMTAPIGHANATLEQFDVPRSQARQRVYQTLQALSGQHVRQHNIPGSRFRNLHVAIVVHGLITRRVSLPAYVLVYRYRDQLYRVVIGGQDTNCLVGDAPYSKAKIALVVLAVVLAIGLLAVAIATG